MESSLCPLQEEVHCQSANDPSEERSVLLPDGQSGDPEKKPGDHERSPGEESDPTGDRTEVRHLQAKSASDRRRMYLKPKITGPGLRTDLLHKKIACWEVTGKVKGYRNEILWRCVCVCGTVAFYSSRELVYNRNRPSSCGCTPNAPRFYLPDRPEIEKRKQRNKTRKRLAEERRRERGEKTRLKINITYELKDKIREWCAKRNIPVERFLLDYIEDVLAGRRYVSVVARKKRKNWSPKNIV